MNMKIKDLLQGVIPARIFSTCAEKEIQSIVCDSRQAVAQSLFFALKGTQREGDQFIDDAIAKGASVIITQKKHSASKAAAHILSVEDPLDCLKKVLPRFFGEPSRTVKTFGVTGTNGKTTVTYLIESILKAAQISCGVIGTVNYRIGPKVLASPNTTPGLIENQSHLAQLKKLSVPYCAMEVSSHALEQGRVELIDFDTAIFTNLTGDHLDYHRDMNHYFQAKSFLFTRLSAMANAILNSDCPYGKKLSKLSRGKVYRYGLRLAEADFSAEKILLGLTGTSFTMKLPEGRLPIKTNLIGQHNIYNILAAAAACSLRGISVEAIQKGVENLRVPGRLEPVQVGQDFHVFVDYAHTDDALANVLKSLRKVSRSKIILVFGCGGDRDKTKRPKMGHAASELADWTILTSDNPRSEDPQLILAEIAQGMTKPNYEMTIDREAAIAKALGLAQKGDILLIAGKGHENYQIFKDRTIHFDDREIVENKLKTVSLRHS